MQLAVRNTFIHVADQPYDDHDELLLRSTSEGHTPQKAISYSGEYLEPWMEIPELPMERCAVIPECPKGDVHWHDPSADAGELMSDGLSTLTCPQRLPDTPEWLIPTPEDSPVQSPRGGPVFPPLPCLLSVLLPSQTANVTPTEWSQSQCSPHAQWCQDRSVAMPPTYQTGKCTLSGIYPQESAAAPVPPFHYGTAPAVPVNSSACTPVAPIKPWEFTANLLRAFPDHSEKFCGLQAQAPPPPKLPWRSLPFGNLHRFHDETHSYGSLSEDQREFTKTKFGGRLSVITEDKVHTSGSQTYVVQFTKGDLSSADGLGFVFSPKLPCSKNIQRIVSIFVNCAGRICMRAQSQVMRSDVGVKPLELGDWISLTIDLDKRVANFSVYPKNGSQPSSAAFAFGEALANAKHLLPRMPTTSVGHFAFVVKNRGVVVAISS